MKRLYTKLIKKATVVSVIICQVLFSVAPTFAFVPNDPGYKDQALFMNQINAEIAWNYSTGSKRIVVAFIDTGLDIWHEDLRDNLWVNNKEIPDNDKDDDNNGYIDDVNGWNFVENNNNVRPSVFDTADDKEAVRHGTIIGGLIGARGNNLLDGTGLSQRVSIMTLRAIKSNGSGSLKGVTEAVKYALENGADVVSMSFVGDSFEQRLYDQMRDAYKKGVVMVVAAGNYDSADANGDTGKKPTYPSCFDTDDGTGENWFLTVGSVDENDKLSDFSEYGKCIDIMAPGEYIYSTERYAPQYGYPDQFGGPWFGTSFATPLVAATVALIKSIHPEYTPKEIIATILSTADPIDSVNPLRAGLVGRGRLNAGRALENSAAIPLKRARGGFWYLNNFEIRRYDFASEVTKPVTFIPEEKVLAYQVYNSYLKEELAIFDKHLNSYFLDVYDEEGNFGGSININKANIISENVSIKHFGSGFYLVSNKYNTKTRKTDYRIYNTKSNIVTNRSVAGQPMVDITESGSLYSILLAKNVATITNSSNNKIVASMNGVSKVLDFRLVDNRAIVLLQKGKNISIASVDLGNGKFISKNFSTKIGKAWKLKMMNFADKTYYLPFLPEKGRYTLFDSDLFEALTVSIPNLPSAVK